MPRSPNGRGVEDVLFQTLVAGLDDVILLTSNTVVARCPVSQNHQMKVTKINGGVIFGCDECAKLAGGSLSFGAALAGKDAVIIP